MFDNNGNLIDGIHELSWDDFKKLYNKNSHRSKLLRGLESAIISLKKAGCRIIFIDGSFVSKKEFPNDFDACWEISDVDLSLLDPILLKFDDGRAAMKTKYSGDLFPAQCNEGITGIRFLDFFQTDKNTGEQKGIIKINLEKIK